MPSALLPCRRRRRLPRRPPLGLGCGVILFRAAPPLCTGSWGYIHRLAQMWCLDPPLAMAARWLIWCSLRSNSGALSFSPLVPRSTESISTSDLACPHVARSVSFNLHIAVRTVPAAGRSLLPAANCSWSGLELHRAARILAAPWCLCSRDVEGKNQARGLIHRRLAASRCILKQCPILNATAVVYIYGTCAHLP
jgi:hypothetical protein